MYFTKVLKYHHLISNEETIYAITNKKINRCNLETLILLAWYYYIW